MGIKTKKAATPSAAQVKRFAQTVWGYYRDHKRDMPWREHTSPYWVTVSEIMLQQTQVDRVMRAFPKFVARFPDWRALAEAPTKDVLAAWSGLGYNRRALFLKRIAEAVEEKSHGAPSAKPDLPSSYDELRELPGIGPNTAGSILAFAFNTPHPFIETNIRSVYIHHFFPAIEKREGKRACKKISDNEIMPIIERTLVLPDVAANPREWHWALMDYGSHLKKLLPNPSRRSAHHIKQSKFEGSNRQLRGRILRFIMQNEKAASDLIEYFTDRAHAAAQVETALEGLTKEGFIRLKKGAYVIS